MDSSEAPDPGANEEGADLRWRREERLAGHRHVEGVIAARDAAEAHLGRAVALDEADQLTAGYAENAAARSAVADRRIGLHGTLLPRIGVDDLQLADDPGADAERPAVRGADDYHVVPDLHVERRRDRHDRKHLGDLQDGKVLRRNLALEADVRRDAAQRRPLDHDSVRRRPLQTIARDD